MNFEEKGKLVGDKYGNEYYVYDYIGIRCAILRMTKFVKHPKVTVELNLDELVLFVIDPTTDCKKYKFYEL